MNQISHVLGLLLVKCATKHVKLEIKIATSARERTERTLKQPEMDEHGSCWLRTYLCYLSGMLAASGKNVIQMGFIVA